MAKSVYIENKKTGLRRKGYIGFSWTYLFFGWMVPFFRGELSVAALHLFFTFFTFGLWQVVGAFIYNRQYMVRMIEEKAYVLADDEYRNQMARDAIGLRK